MEQKSRIYPENDIDSASSFRLYIFFLKNILYGFFVLVVGATTTEEILSLSHHTPQIQPYSGFFFFLVILVVVNEKTSKNY